VSFGILISLRAEKQWVDRKSRRLCNFFVTDYDDAPFDSNGLRRTHRASQARACRVLNGRQNRGLRAVPDADHDGRGDVGAARARRDGVRIMSAQRAIGSTVGFAVMGSVLAAWLNATLDARLAGALPDVTELSAVVAAIVACANQLRKA
jgi:hypothetical protein